MLQNCEHFVNVNNFAEEYSKIWNEGDFLVLEQSTPYKAGRRPHVKSNHVFIPRF